MSDIDTAAVDSVKALDPKRPIREADITVLRIVATRNDSGPYSADDKSLL